MSKISQAYNSAPKSVKIGIWVVGTGIVLFTAWKLSKSFKGIGVKNKTVHNKSFYVEYLVQNGKANKGSVEGMMNFGDDYLRAWYEAAKKNYPTFTVNNKIYLTHGGKAA